MDDCRSITRVLYLVLMYRMCRWREARGALVGLYFVPPRVSLLVEGGPAALPEEPSHQQ